MIKKNSDSGIGIVHIASFILVGLIIGVFATLITTANDKNYAKEQMNAVGTYVKQQCIRYEELSSEDTSGTRLHGKPFSKHTALFPAIFSKVIRKD